MSRRRHSINQAGLASRKRGTQDMICLPEEEAFSHFTAAFGAMGRGRFMPKDNSASYIKAAAVARTPLAVGTRRSAKVEIVTSCTEDTPQVSFDGTKLRINAKDDDPRVIAGQLLAWTKVHETREYASFTRSQAEGVNPIMGAMYWAVEAAVARRCVLVDEGWLLREYYAAAGKADDGYQGNNPVARRIDEAARCLRYGMAPKDTVVAETLQEFAYRIFRRPGRFQTAMEIIERLIERSTGEGKDNGKEQGQGKSAGKPAPGQGQGKSGAKAGDIADVDLDAAGADGKQGKEESGATAGEVAHRVENLLGKTLPGGVLSRDFSSHVKWGAGEVHTCTSIESMSGVMFTIIPLAVIDAHNYSRRKMDAAGETIAKTMMGLLPRPSGDRMMDSRFSRSGALDDLRLAELPLYAADLHPPVFVTRTMLHDPNARMRAIFLYDVSSSMSGADNWENQFHLATGIEKALAESRIGQVHYAFNDALYRLPSPRNMPSPCGETSLSNAVCGIAQDLMSEDHDSPRLVFVFTDAELMDDDVSLCEERLKFLRQVHGIKTYATIIGDVAPAYRECARELFPQHVFTGTLNPVDVARTVGGMLCSAIEDLRHESMRGILQ